MSIQISDVSSTRKQCVIVYPSHEFKNDYEQKVRGFRGQLPGFRPGKVPRQVIEKKCGLGFRQELVDGKLRKAWQEISNQFQPLGSPDIAIEPQEVFTVSIEQQSDISITLSFDVTPTITPIELSQWGLSLDAIPAVSDDERKKYIKHLQTRYGTEVDSEKSAEAGNIVHVDMTYLKDNKTENDLSLTLDADEIHPDFVKHLVGKNVGDEVEFDYTPIQYGKNNHHHDHDHSQCDHDHEHDHNHQEPLAVKVLVKKICTIEPASVEKVYQEISQDQQWDEVKWLELVDKTLGVQAYKNHFRANEQKVMDHFLSLHQVEVPGAHYEGKHFANDKEKSDFEKSVRQDYLLERYGRFLNTQVLESDVSFFADLFCEESNIPPMLFQYFLRSEKKFQQQFYTMVSQRIVVKAIIDALTSKADAAEDAHEKKAKKSSAKKDKASGNDKVEDASAS